VKLLEKGLLYLDIHSSVARRGEICRQVFPVKGVKYSKVPAAGLAIGRVPRLTTDQCPCARARTSIGCSIVTSRPRASAPARI
jgi:hypothetical protein